MDLGPEYHRQVLDPAQGMVGGDSVGVFGGVDVALPGQRGDGQAAGAQGGECARVGVHCGHWDAAVRWHPRRVAQPVHQGRMRDLIGARLDVSLEHQLTRAGGELVDFGDRVMGSTFPAEPATWEKVSSRESAPAPDSGPLARCGPARWDTEPATFVVPALGTFYRRWVDEKSRTESEEVGRQ